MWFIEGMIADLRNSRHTSQISDSKRSRKLTLGSLTQGAIPFAIGSYDQRGDVLTPSRSQHFAPRRFQRDQTTGFTCPHVSVVAVLVNDHSDFHAGQEPRLIFLQAAKEG